MDISIICVNWNSLDYLRHCIASIYENTHEIEFEIIVVDNASPEEGVEAIRLRFPDVVILESGENVGFARANNLGFERSQGKYVLLLNPDTQVIGPAINTLLRAIETQTDAGIVGAKLLNPDLSTHTSSIQKFPTIVNQVLDCEFLQRRWPRCPLWDISPLFAHDRTPVVVEVIPGACMLLKREVFQRVGMFSEDYFMYAEDLDLNYKVRALGLSSYYVGNAEVIHYGGGSSSRQKRSQWATMMKYEAMLCFYQKYRGGAYGVLYRAAMAFCALGRLTLLALIAPFSDRTAASNAVTKWRAVLKWAIGLERVTV